MQPPKPALREQYLEEVIPHEAATLYNGARPDIRELHIEGGIVEVSESDLLNRNEAHFLTLGALGLTDAEIAESTKYSLANIRKYLASGYDKIEAVNGRHAVSRLFHTRMFRVISPIEIPALRRGKLQPLLEQIADGKSIAEAAPFLDVTVKTAETYSNRIREQLHVPNLTRAVMIGHLGELIVPSPEYYPAQIPGSESTLSITPGIAIAQSDSALPIDYVRWNHGILSFSNDTALKPFEQTCFLLSAVGLTHHQISDTFGYNPRSIDNALSSTYCKLHARNRAHAIGNAIAMHKIRSHGGIEPVDLPVIEQKVLLKAAQGFNTMQTENMLRLGNGMAREYSSNVQKRLEVHTIGAAVLKSFLAGMITAEDFYKYF